MACNQENARYHYELAILADLQNQLRNAPAPSKPALVQQIKAQQKVVASARAAYEKCIRHHSSPPSVLTAAIEATIQHDFSGDVTKRRDITQPFHFSGLTDVRDVNSADISIPLGQATAKLSTIYGKFYRSSGAISLQANVDVHAGAIGGSTGIILTTGAARSPNNIYQGTGSSLDPATGRVTVVGGGRLNVAFSGVEFFVTLVIDFEGTP